MQAEGPSHVDASLPSSCCNCGASYPVGAAYCPDCGQATLPLRWNLLDWAYEGLSTFFHFEGKTWRTVRDIWVPGRIQAAYVAGQRQCYLHPLRILLLGILFLFAAVTLFENTTPTIINFDDDEPKEREVNSTAAEFADLEIARERSLESYVDFERRRDSLKAWDSSSAGSLVLNAQLDSVERELEILADSLGNLQGGNQVVGKERKVGDLENHPAMQQGRQIDLLRAKVAAHDVIHARIDSLVARHAIVDTVTLNLLDSVAAAVGSPEDFLIADTTKLLFGEQYVMEARNIAESPADGLPLDGLNSAFNRLLVTRGFQLFREGNDSFRDYVWSNMSWAILGFVPLLGMIYKGFYYRKRPFYAQHLVHVSILVAFGLVLIVIGTAVQDLLSGRIWLLMGLIHLGYSVASDRNFYHASYLSSFVKMIGVSLLGIIAFSISFAFYLFLVVLLGG